MTTRLKNLVITKVALCPKGQNPEANIVFFKSQEPTPNPASDKVELGTDGKVAKETFDNIANTPMRQRFSAWNKAVECFDVLREALATSVLYPSSSDPIDGNEVNTTLKQFTGAVKAALAPVTKEDSVDYSKMSQEELVAELTKRDAANAPKEGTVTKEQLEALPAEVKKMIEDQNALIAKAQADAAAAQDAARVEKEAREKVEAIKKGKETYPNLPGSDDEKGVIVQSLNKMDEASRKVFEQVLKAGDEAVKTSTLKVEGDDHAHGTDTAYDRLMGFAKEIQKAQPVLTEAQAFDQACQKNPDAYAEYRRENRRIG